MSLLGLFDNQYKIVSVIGMAKNSGKTVTLNRIIEEAYYKNTCIGLTSIGRDGEKQDIVTSTEKPLIYINEGNIIATATELFNISKAKLEILRTTDFTTSMGNIIIARALSDGYVELAGPCTNSEIRRVSEMMVDLGAELVLVDGALDRSSSASPSISDATVLASGAVLSRDMNKVIDKTLHQVSLFNLEELDSRALSLAKEGLYDYNIFLINEDEDIQGLDIKTAINSGAKIAATVREDTRYIVFSGSLVTKTLKDLVENVSLRDITLVVRDATRIFIDSKDYKYFKRIGIRIKVIDKINLLGLTINPYSPRGYYFNPKDFHERMSDAIPDTRIIDVMMEA